MVDKENQTTRLIRESQSLIAKVKSDLAGTAQFYDSIGVKPEKVLPALDAHMGPKQRAELARLVAEDNAAIEREVAEQAARLGLGVKSSTSARSNARKFI